MQNILGHIRRADNDFKLIERGDKIAIGLSGGKDSLTLLAALKQYQKYNDKDFEIVAITIDCTDGQTDFSKLQKFCADLGVEYRIERSQIFHVIFDVRRESSPCSLCSKMRRGLLVSVAKQMGCNKIAFGHHGDDLVETMLLCWTHEGRLTSFDIKSYLDRQKVTLIRPLVYVTEAETRAAAKDFPILKNTCRANGHTRREYMKQLVTRLDADIPHARERMLAAVIRKKLLDTKS